MPKAAAQTHVANSKASTRPPSGLMASRPFAAPKELSEKLRLADDGKSGNAAAGPSFSFGKLAIQPKLTVGAVDDPLEHEADRVADQVMRMPDPELSIGSAPLQMNRKCAACEEDEAKEKLQMKPATASSPQIGDTPGLVHDVLRSSGQPLDEATRDLMERHFGHDFGQVRVHSGFDAALSAQALNAKAYTVGSHVVFGSAGFAPGSQGGRRLLAHELAHVVQQSAAPAQTNQLQRQNGDDGVSDTIPAQAEPSGPQKELAKMVATLRDAIASQGIDPTADPDPTAAPNTKAGLLQTLANLESLLAVGTPDEQQAVIDSIHQASNMTNGMPIAQQKSFSITKPSNPLEQEADAAAESIFSPEASVPRLSHVPTSGPALVLRQVATPWPLVECGPWCWALLAGIVITELVAASATTGKKTKDAGNCYNIGSGGCNYTEKKGVGTKRCSYGCDNGTACSDQNLACGPGNYDPACPTYSGQRC